MTSQKELKMLYKAETSNSPNDMECWAKRTNHGIVLDEYDLDFRIDNMLPHDRKQVELRFKDPDYVEWLENKLMELLP